MRPLTTDLNQKDLRPYFLWDEDLSIAELELRLKGSDMDERIRLIAKIMREARDIDLWQFTTLAEVAALFDRIVLHLGRRRRFWEFLIEGWRDDGIIAG